MATVNVGGTDITITGSVADVSEKVRIAAATDGWVDGTIASAPVRVRAASVSVVKA